MKRVAIAVLVTSVIYQLPVCAKTMTNHGKLEQSVGEAGLQLRAGESFLKARTRILKYGYKPIPMHRDDGYEYDGAEKRLAERKFFEVDSCSIDAGANCVLYYRKAAQCLRVDTVGEQVETMKVTRWTDECPSSGS